MSQKNVLFKDALNGKAGRNGFISVNAYKAFDGNGIVSLAVIDTESVRQEEQFHRFGIHHLFEIGSERGEHVELFDYGNVARVVGNFFDSQKRYFVAVEPYRHRIPALFVAVNYLRGVVHVNVFAIGVQKYSRALLSVFGIYRESRVHYLPSNSWILSEELRSGETDLFWLQEAII